jgi:hypothetical protein
MQKVRSRRLRDALVLGLAAVFATTAAGCFGKFRAVGAVYDFNREASDNTVVRSLLMCALVLIPVYEIAFFIDVLVLHVVDFFNGTNKVAVRTLPDGSKLELAKVDADTVHVRRVDPAGKETTFDVVRVGPNAGYVRGADGKIVGSVERLSDGRLLEQVR